MDHDPGQLEVRLRCLECGSIGSFRFERAMVDPRPAEVDPDWDGICFSHAAKCAQCDAEDRYELVKPSARALRARAVSVANESEALLSGEPVVRASMRAWDGTVVRRPSQAIARLRGQVESRPDSAEAWRRLGNACAKFGLYDDSEQALRKALDIDASELPAAVELAALLWFLGRDDVAPAVQEALQRWGQARTGQFDRRELAERLVRVMKDLAAATDDEGSLEVVWAGAAVGDQAVIQLSKVDLRKIDRWARLTDLLASGEVFGARIVPGVPPEEPTQLQTLLDSTAEHSEPAVVWARAPGSSTRPAPTAWRSSSKKRNRRDRKQSRSR